MSGEILYTKEQLAKVYEQLVRGELKVIGGMLEEEPEEVILEALELAYYRRGGLVSEFVTIQKKVGVL